MTLVGLVSDAHGNPLGLRACLAALRGAGAQDLYFLGDAVGYLPGEADVLDLLANENVHCQWGNHEAMLLGELALDPERDRIYGLAAVRSRLSDVHRGFITSWPRSRTLTVDGRRILLVHGSPADPLSAYVYPDAELSGFASLGYDAVFMGNTHRPFVTICDGTVVANVGSCGLPRDQGDLASCLIFDATRCVAEVLRVRVPASSVIAQFGAVHPTIEKCLHRVDPKAFGSIVQHP